MPAAAALAAGIFAQRWLRLAEQEYLLLAGLLLLAAALALRLNRAAGAILFALLGTALAGAFFLLHWSHERPPSDIENLALARRIELHEPIRLTGWIAGVETRRGSDELYLLELEQVESAQRVWQASGRIRLNHYRFEKSEPRLGLRYGERVGALARLRPVRGFHNVGSFDREARARREGAIYYASIKAAELVQRLPGRRGSRVRGALFALRETLLNRLDRLFPPQAPGNGLLRAMLLGDRSGLDPRVSDDFQKSGTYHALVVSGMNAAAVAAFFLLLLRWMRLPALAATALSLVALAMYVVLSGESIPILRAGLMVALYLAARLVYRQRALLNTIAAAALVLLALHPADLQDAGFQLSFFSVLLIAGIAVPWIEQSSAPYRRALDDLDNRDRELWLTPKQAQFRIEMRLLRDALREKLPAWFFVRAVRALLRLWELFVVALVCQIGLLLPLTVYFHRAGWVSVAANLLIVPLLGLVVTLGIAALLVALVSLPVAGLLAIPLAAVLETMLAVARWHAGLGAASIRVAAPPAWLSLLFLASVALAAAGLLRRERGCTLAGATVTLAAAVLITWHPFAPRINNRELEITALDVGQGDALVVVAPPGRVLVEDCGGLAGPDSGMDTGEQIVSAYLWSRGIRRIDVLAVSHAHHDHIGGFPAILANFPVGEVWLPALRDFEPYERLREMAEQRGIPVRFRGRGEAAALGDAGIVFLSPGADYAPARRAQNNDSLVMRITYGGRTALLAGDVERKMEMAMVTAGAPLRADWLKAPHHGSKTSNSREFLRQVSAPFGVVSVAANSPFGHPHQEALDRLREAGTRVFRTDLDGAVTWTTDGRRIRLTTFAWDRPREPTDLW